MFPSPICHIFFHKQYIVFFKISDNSTNVNIFLYIMYIFISIYNFFLSIFNTIFKFVLSFVYFICLMTFKCFLF